MRFISDMLLSLSFEGNGDCNRENISTRNYFFEPENGNFFIGKIEYTDLNTDCVFAEFHFDPSDCYFHCCNNVRHLKMMTSNAMLFLCFYKVFPCLLYHVLSFMLLSIVHFEGSLFLFGALFLRKSLCD